MKFGRYRIHVMVTSAGQSHTRLPKYQETSSCFSLCCFVIYVYIFVLDKQQDLSVIILLKKVLHSQPQHDL